MNFGNEQNNFRLLEVLRSKNLPAPQYVETTLQFVEAIQPGHRIEVILPEYIDFGYFVCQCGRAKIGYEIGGVFNRITRSLIIARGGATGDLQAFSNPSVQFVAPRQNDVGQTDDEFWHTHPWTTYTISQKDRNCLPSLADNNSLLWVSLINQNVGHGQLFSSTIGSQGYISITTVGEINYDEVLLTSLGLNASQLREVGAILTFSPPIWIGNLAKPGKEQELTTRVCEYYKLKLRKDGSFATNLDEFTAEISELLVLTMRRGRIDNKEQAEKHFKDTLLNQVPSRPEQHVLAHLGITPTVADKIVQMVGMYTNTFEISEIGVIKLVSKRQ